VDGRFKEQLGGTKNLPLIPAARIISQVKANFLEKSKSPQKFSAYAEFDYTFKQNHPFTAYQTETPTNGYVLINAGFTAHISNKSKSLFNLYFIAGNLGDVAYQNHLSRLKYTEENLTTGRLGVFNMGRNFTIRLNIPLNFETKKQS